MLLGALQEGVERTLAVCRQNDSIGKSCLRHSGVGMLDLLSLGHLAFHKGLLDRRLVLRLGLLSHEQLVGLLVELFLRQIDAQLALVLEALLLESQLARVTDALDGVDGLNGLDPQITIVSYWRVALLFKIKCRVKSHLLTLQSARGFGPLHLAGIMLAFEMLMALRSAESKDFRVVTNEGDAVTRVDARRAEPALFNSHTVIFSSLL